MLTRGLAVELGAYNIQENGIAPGYFRTDMNQALMDDPEFDNWVKHQCIALDEVLHGLIWPPGPRLLLKVGLIPAGDSLKFLSQVGI